MMLTFFQVDEEFAFWPMSGSPVYVYANSPPWPSYILAPRGKQVHMVSTSHPPLHTIHGSVDGFDRRPLTRQLFVSI